MSDAAAAAGLDAAATETARADVRARSRLVLASALMLFVELALIRWTAENNLHLAYVQNFVLLASFLGIGVGFLRADMERDLLAWSAVVLAVLVALVLAFPVSLTTFSGTHGLQGRFGIAPLPNWVSLPVIFVLSAGALLGLGHAVARLFR